MFRGPSRVRSAALRALMAADVVCDEEVAWPDLSRVVAVGMGQQGAAVDPAVEHRESACVSHELCNQRLARLEPKRVFVAKSLVSGGLFPGMLPQVVYTRDDYNRSLVAGWT